MNCAKPAECLLPLAHVICEELHIIVDAEHIKMEVNHYRNILGGLFCLAKRTP